MLVLDLRLVDPPAETAITLDEVKLHCRIDHADEDALLLGLIGAATDHIEGRDGVLGRCLVAQRWAFDVDQLRGPVRLPFPDASAAAIVAEGGPVSAADVELVHDVRGAIVRPADGATWPTGRATIEFVTGWPDADAVPDAIKHAMLLLIGHWYERREATTGERIADLPFGVAALLGPYRRNAV